MPNILRKHSLIVPMAAGLLAASWILAQSRQTATSETIDQWTTELSKWGRWGKDDERGAINLITAAKRKQAASLVKEGASFSLSRDAEKEKAVDNPVPFGHEKIRTGVNNPGSPSADKFILTPHGYPHTHMDSLFPPFFHGQIFNRFPH